MLRIFCSQRWTLWGQLAGPWVQELRACWDRGRHVADGPKAVVDMKGVTFIDENGEALLSEMRAAGVEFIAGGVETKHLLENLKADERPMRRMIASRGCLVTQDCQFSGDTSERENSEKPE
jgi:hypothetical protein